MTDADEQPEWDRLPHDPEGFFGLSGGYDRRDLKRAYNRFVKRFKPERAPAEFQRIRAAFEELDQQLRYGDRFRRTVEPELRYEWTVPEESAADGESPVVERQRQPTSDESTPTERPRERPPRRSPLFERVRNEDPADLYEELRKTEHKQPYHFYALAVLSDVVKGPGTTFLSWLLAGLKEYPLDPALYGLLHETLRTEFPAKSIPRILETVSKTVSDDRFFALTEPLWDTLLVEAKFSVFKETLANCDRNVLDVRVLGRIVFLVHIARRAMFRADRKWLNETLATIDEHSRELGGALEYDLEFLDVMRGYLRNRRRFLDGSPLRDEIDQLLADYCERDEFGREQAFLAFQVGLVDRGEELFEAFPHDDDEDFEYLFDVWKWLYFETRERSASPQDEGFEIDDAFVKSVYSLLQMVDADTDRTARGRMWNVSVWVYMLIMGAAYIGVFALVVGLSYLVFGGSDAMILAVLGGVAVAFVGGRAIVKQLVEPMWSRYCAAMASACYEAQWRLDVLRFLRRTHAPVWEVQRVVEYLVENVQEVARGQGTWLRAYLAGDAALVLYSTALPFVK